MRVFWPQIMENAEISNVVKIMGLQFNKKYSSEDELKTLRYGKMMIMTDQVTQTGFMIIYRLFIIVLLGLKNPVFRATRPYLSEPAALDFFYENTNCFRWGLYN